jgi:phosphotransferase system enzyme I (PtsI)
MSEQNLILKGIPASPGIVIGRARVVSDLGDFKASYRLVYTENDKAVEVERFERAVDQAHEDLTRLKEKLEAEFPEHTHLLDLHLLILKDQMLYGEPLRLIKESNLNAEWALYRSFERVRELFSHIEDPYIKGRIQDVESVYRRLLGNLSGKDPPRYFSSPEPLILVARDLSPAETSQMAGSKVLGFITERGGKTSHTAIMAQSLEIPAVVGLDNATRVIAPGDEIILDGLTGRVILSPGKGVIRKYETRKQEFEVFKAGVARSSLAPAVTPDGFPVRVLANIEFPEEVQLAQKYGADGVGLYRTEFLYMRQRQLPTEDELFEDYRRVVAAMQPRLVTIRTLDIGGDKFMPRQEYAPEMNPALGLRAIRFCLKEQEIFRTQLRAILRASAFGQVRVMFPLISSVQEMRSARLLLKAAQGELAEQGIPFDPNLLVGAMIEVPAAVTLCRLLTREADFFSIGTNDLIQYALAIDRSNKMVAPMYQPLHPAVIHMVHQVVAAGREAGIPVAMCGEMAGDPLHIPILLGLGVDELSMNALAIPVVKSVIRQFNLEEARQMAETALGMVTVDEINDFATQVMSKRFPEIYRFGSALAGIP